MDFYDENDMNYWRKQAQLGKAVIIEIPTSMLLDLDISCLSREKGKAVTEEDLIRWMDENRDEIMAELAKEAAQKEEVEKLSQNLYHTGEEQKGSPGIPPRAVTETEAPAAPANGDTVASIMAREIFTDAQIEVIAEAMLEGLPEKYMLCFLKKEYSPEIMRRLKDYCTKLYREEVGGNDGSRH